MWYLDMLCLHQISQGLGRWIMQVHRQAGNDSRNTATLHSPYLSTLAAKVCGDLQ